MKERIKELPPFKGTEEFLSRRLVEPMCEIMARNEEES